jgi:hypothetical protein
MITMPSRRSGLRVTLWTSECPVMHAPGRTGSKVEKLNGEPYNVEFETVSSVKDSGKIEN